MIRLLTIASFFAASIRLINSNEYDASRALTPSNRENIDSLSTEALSISQLPIYVTDFGEEKNNNRGNNYVKIGMPQNTKLDALKVITECDFKRTLKNCADVVKISIGEHQKKKEDNGPLGTKFGDKLVETLTKQKITNNTIIGLKSKVYKRGPTQPTYLTSSIPLNDNKVSTTDKGRDTKALESWQVKSTELIHEASLVLDNGYVEISTFTSEDEQENYISTEIDQVTFSTPKTPNKVKSKVTMGDKVLHTPSLGQTRDSLAMAPEGTENFVKLKNHTVDQYVTRRPRIKDIFKIASNSSANVSRQITSKQTTFGKIRYAKPLEVSPNTTILPLNSTEQTTLSLPTSLFDTTKFKVTFPMVETTQAMYASTASTSEVLDNTRHIHIINANESIEKITQEIPWPVKKEAIVEGDIILGGLMMVHEREDSITCGPVMPQGGIQTLEAMLFTLDRLNSSPEPLLPNITLGAHILDDCDKDTYGLEMAVDFIKDEAHFWLSGYVNKQNCRFRCENNPQQIHEKPLYPLKVTVWCGLWYGGIIGPFFLQNEAGDAVTVNDEQYRQMLRNFLWPNLDALDLEDMWFQQDGATCHTAHETIDILQEKFDERIISRNVTVQWPPRSCDLTPLDYFFWGYLKSKAYENRPQTLDALRLNIEPCIRQITPDLLHKVIENWVRRIHSCTQVAEDI